MNRRTKVLSFLILFAIAMLVSSCKKDPLNPLNPLGNCDQLAADFSEAYNAYLTSPSVATCEAFVDAYEDYINGCASWAGWNPAYDNMLDNVDCSEEGQ
jgi:hypothetical protein